MKRVAVCLKPQQSNYSEGYSIWRHFPFGIVGIRTLNYSLTIKRTYDVDLIAFVMAPKKYYHRIIELCAFGFSGIVYISDPLIAGADSLGTAKILAKAINKYDCDIVITGKSSEDSCTGQVPVQVAMAIDAQYVTDDVVDISSLRNANNIIIAVEQNYPEFFPTLSTIQKERNVRVDNYSLFDLGLLKDELKYTEVIRIVNTQIDDTDSQITEMTSNEAVKYLQEIIDIEVRKR